jgi:hypothetical protein
MEMRVSGSMENGVWSVRSLGARCAAVAGVVGVFAVVLAGVVVSDALARSVVVAGGGSGVGQVGGGASFTPSPVVLIESESVLNVSSDSADFEGVLNPLGVSGEWWVEYGVGEGVFDHATARQPLAAVSEGVIVGVRVHGLSPSMVYHYRFAASDEREGHLYTIYGQSLSFTTQPAMPSSSLLDGRAWEMVSPLDKQGASFHSDSGAQLNEAAVNGAGITYAATASTEASPAGEPALEDVQILSRHDPAGGWSSRDIASPHEQSWFPQAGGFTEFFAFSPDLSVGFVEPKGTTLLGGASERTPYLRRQADCENPAAASECYLPLLTAENVTSGEKWGGRPDISLGYVSYAAATPDLRHVVLQSKVPLTAEAKADGVRSCTVLPGWCSVYEWSAGRLELIGVLPGEPGTPVCLLGISAISADGDRVVCGAGHLYMQEAAAHRTVQLDVVQSGASGAGFAGPGFQGASSNGSRVFFTDSQQLTADSRTAGDLYVFEANADTSPEAGVVRDLTPASPSGEAANVQSTPGVSSDGTVAYVIATGVLTEAANQHGETAQSGQPNVYRIERAEAAGEVTWTPSFIATISSEDPTAVVSADGRWLAFMSELPLTGYDNRDAVSAQRDEEVFLYDAVSRRLVCASCNPTGARPHGAAVIQGRESGGVEVGRIYQPRDLSASGRVFFDSVDALAPQDVNGTSDVYEYEPTGVGSCTTASASYSPSQDGCIGLVSSGISSEESVFLDATEDGNDVFFLTSAKLVAGDTDNALDVYDAHVCGPGWECPPPTVVTTPCTNTASCQQAAEPQPSVFGASGTAAFSGAGDRAHVVRHEKARCRRGHARRRGGCVRRRRRGGWGRKSSRRHGRGR